jgi:hypothetical protein
MRWLGASVKPPLETGPTWTNDIAEMPSGPTPAWTTLARGSKKGEKESLLAFHRSSARLHAGAVF